MARFKRPLPDAKAAQCDESAQPQATQSCRVTRSAGGDPRALQGAKAGIAGLLRLPSSGFLAASHCLHTAAVRTVRRARRC